MSELRPGSVFGLGKFLKGRVGRQTTIILLHVSRPVHYSHRFQISNRLSKRESCARFRVFAFIA